MSRIMPEAIKSWKSGEYDKALGYFQELSATMGADLFRTNINLCMQRLKEKEEVLEKTEQQMLRDSVIISSSKEWQTFSIGAGEIFILEGRLASQEASNKRAVLLVKLEDKKGECFDLSSHCLQWSTNHQEWFKYVNAGQKPTQIFRIKCPQGSAKIQIALIKHDFRDNDYVTLEDARVLSVSDTSITAALEDYLANQNDMDDITNIVYADISLNTIDGSSVWLSSITQAASKTGKTLLFSKEDIKHDHLIENIKMRKEVVILEPGAFLTEAYTCLDVSQAIECIRVIDNYLPNVRNVIIRGLHATDLLTQGRQFKWRVFTYLTDFYTYNSGNTCISDLQKKTVKRLSDFGCRFITQTNKIESQIKSICPQAKTFHIPPIIPDIRFSTPSLADNNDITIVYAGKIAPLWGVKNLLDWTRNLRSIGYNIRLKIIANKISDPHNRASGFKKWILDEIKSLEAELVGGLSRQDVLQEIRKADYVWCFRPKELEDSVLEISSKLVEAVATGARAINYPSLINKELLGVNYPFFIKNQHDLENLLKDRSYPVKTLHALATKISSNFSLRSAQHQLLLNLNTTNDQTAPFKRILFAGHDRKFIDPYYSYLKSMGYSVLFDEWEWGDPKNDSRNSSFADWADVIFCEWGLANASYYSKNILPPKKLFIRIHLQEINPRAKKFGNSILHESVSSFIVVSDRVLQSYQEQFTCESAKLTHIPNFVMDDEFYLNKSREHLKDEITLGMVGIVPQRKRFDRAIKLLRALLELEYEAKLIIKGPRPEEYQWMNAPGRAEEMAYYKNCFNQIENSPILSKSITFMPWDHSMPHWYNCIDFILSPSEFESFHYSVADGVLSGCFPLIWPWEEAATIYPPEWVINDFGEAIHKIISFRNLPQEERTALLTFNRNQIISRYGYTSIFGLYNSLILT